MVKATDLNFVGINNQTHASYFADYNQFNINLSCGTWSNTWAVSDSADGCTKNVDARIAAAMVQTLQWLLWGHHDIKLSTKLLAYRMTVTATVARK